MTKAIDNVLGGYGNKSLATEFPKFTWNSYFMISGIPTNNFNAHPPNNFINPVTDNGNSLGYQFSYNNFNGINRVVVIISNVDGDINYFYSANITAP